MTMTTCKRMALVIAVVGPLVSAFPSRAVLQPPSIAKAFTPAAVPTLASSTLTLTLTNPNGASTLNGVAFSDVLPAGVSVLFPSTIGQCGGTLTMTSTTITLAGASIGASGTCTIPVVVQTSSSCGVRNNLTGTVSSTNAGTGGSASASLTVFGPATGFTVSTPPVVPAGSPFSFTVTAVDQCGDTAAGYSGTVVFSGSDGAAILPSSSTLTNGVGTFSATLTTIGNQTISARDSVNANITGTSSALAVVAAIPATSGWGLLLLGLTLLALGAMRLRRPGALPPQNANQSSPSLR